MTLRDLFAPGVVSEIERLVDERVEQRLADVTPSTSSPWMTRAEAATYLHVSPSTIDRLRRQGRVRVEFVGRSPLFHRDDLDDLARSWRPS